MKIYMYTWVRFQRDGKNGKDFDLIRVKRNGTQVIYGQPGSDTYTDIIPSGIDIFGDFI